MTDIIPQTTFIYILIDPETNEVRYVGKSNNPQRRLKEHIHRYNKPRYKDHWIGALRARGLVPIMQIIEEVPFDLWAMRELHWINHYLEHGHPLTNTYFGSEGTGVIPPETRAKLSASHKGRKNSPEAIAKTAAAHRGRKNSPETIAKMSAARAGVKRKPFSEEWRRNLGNATRGKKHTPETRAKIAASATGRKREPFSEEWRRNLSKGQHGRKLSPETRNKIADARRGKKHSPEARANMSLGKKRARAMRESPPNTP